jgi:SAM-dependent methyltransferase
MQLAPWLRRGLDGFRGRFPHAYWRGRNAVALGEWWLSRTWPGASAGDAYDEAFWDFHDTGDWDGFAALVLGRWPVGSVVDIGCGHGLLLAALRRADPSLSVFGYDGSEAALARARSRGLTVARLDLTAMSRDGAVRLAHDLGRFELAMCLEVAEHIPSWHADKLLTILAGVQKVVFSAAHPNQGGHLHVNEQPARYWIERLAARGLTLVPWDDQFRADVAGLSLPWWYKTNVHAFER